MYTCKDTSLYINFYAFMQPTTFCQSHTNPLDNFFLAPKMTHPRPNVCGKVIVLHQIAVGTWPAAQPSTMSQLDDCDTRGPQWASS